MQAEDTCSTVPFCLNTARVILIYVGTYSRIELERVSASPRWLCLWSIWALTTSF